MFIKIYFGDKPLFLCDNVDKTIEPYVHHDDAIFIDELNTHTVKSIIHEMGQPQVRAGVFFHPNLEELRKAFFKKFSLILAAGGLVWNEKDEILMIFRRGKWDLPKGKLDKEEKLEDCAIREVEEETGLKNTRLISPLTVTHHTYHEGSKFILKETNWFTMKASSEQNLRPQEDEDIFDIRWISKNDLENYKKDSFPLITDVLNTALKIH